MSNVLMIKDNPETIFDTRDFTYHIERHMGHEAADYFKELFEKAEAEIESIKCRNNTDLNNYESSLESNTTAFQDIQDVVLSILKYCNGLIEYTNKFKTVKPIMQQLEEIKKIINNQI